MKNQLLKRMSAMLMAGAMVVAMSGMSVCAEKSTQSFTPTITKKITKNANVYAPSTDFTFTIEPGAAVAGTESTPAINAGPVGGAKFENEDGIITSTPKQEDILATTVTAGTKTITIDEKKFSVPGIYRYVVKEENGNYSGLTYTTEEKYFDVHVTVNGEGTKSFAYGFVSKDNPLVKDSGIFTNDYDSNGERLHNLKVTKNVTGNQGQTGKDFEFTLKVDGADGEQYYVVFADNRTPITLVSGTAATITLSDDQSVTIYGLSEDDAYTVTETPYTSEGYKTTYKIDNGSAVTGNKANGTISADTTVTFENNKNVDTPTGIVAAYAPYILMVVVAGAAVVLFLRRRNRAEF